MRERFAYTGENKFKIPQVMSFILLWIAIISAFVFSTLNFRDYTYSKQHESLENALMQNIAQCYAIEGIYPPDIEYLKDHYGLFYNEKYFFVDYRSIGSNLYPDVTVIDLYK